MTLYDLNKKIKLYIIVVILVIGPLCVYDNILSDSLIYIGNIKYNYSLNLKDFLGNFLNSTDQVRQFKSCSFVITDELNSIVNNRLYSGSCNVLEDIAYPDIIMDQKVKNPGKMRATKLVPNPDILILYGLTLFFAESFHTFLYNYGMQILLLVLYLLERMLNFSVYGLLFIMFWLDRDGNKLYIYDYFIVYILVMFVMYSI